MEHLYFREIYLDNNATTQPLPKVIEAMLEVLGEGFGNPSSAHSTGNRARVNVCKARDLLAELIGVDPDQIFFTSGGTEANNMALASAVKNSLGTTQIITTQVEHSSILKFCNYLAENGANIVYLPVDHNGHISLVEIEEAISPKTALISVQWVNNETGIIQPIKAIGEICRKHGIPFHTDAAQAVGKIGMNVSEMPIDFLSLTAHKFHGPQGIGALYGRNRRYLRPMFHGGPQEYGLRAGTENVPGIVGIGKAAELRFIRLSEIQEKLACLRDRFENLVLEMVPGTKVNGERNNRVCNTTNILFSNIKGQALVAQLDQAGIRCSQSSACTNQNPEPSYVLRAMGLTEDEAYSSVRFSFSELNTFEEVDYAVRIIAEIYNKLRTFEANICNRLGNARVLS